jgi:2-polyprenyl-6-methoxyphenol hydroxylase-like FAD-dependent oxidoreductase
VNVCVVTGPRPGGGTPEGIIREAMARDPGLRRRSAAASFVSPIRVLGPLAVDVRAQGAAGLLLAGDAAGFVDPMTGDGLRLAMTSAVLAAREALATLTTGDVVGAPDRLAAARRRALGGKLRFNRAVRRLVDLPWLLDLAGWSATVAPGFVRRAVRYAGDAA